MSDNNNNKTKEKERIINISVVGAAIGKGIPTCYWKRYTAHTQYEKILFNFYGLRLYQNLFKYEKIIRYGWRFGERRK